MAIGNLSSIGKKDTGGSSKLYLIQFDGAKSPVVSFYSTIPLTNYKELYDYLKSKFPYSTSSIKWLRQTMIETSDSSKTCVYATDVFIRSDYIYVGCYLYQNSTFTDKLFEIYESTPDFRISCIEM